MNSGFFVQSRFGARGNFEVVFPMPPHGLDGIGHCYRDNDASNFPWSALGKFTDQRPHGDIDDPFSVSLIQSNYGENLEVLAWGEDEIVHYYRDEQFIWHGPGGTGIRNFGTDTPFGVPAFIQSTFGTRGNFELVVADTAGGFAHYFRDNDNDQAWKKTAFIGGFGDPLIEALALLQSNYGNPGNLEVLARSGDFLFTFYRDSEWHGPFELPLVEAVKGRPSFIQSNFGSMGNFEMVTPLANGGLAHYFRDNDAAEQPWIQGAVFAQSSGIDFTSVSLIQSNFGNLEVIASDYGPHLYHFWRDSQWHGPYTIF